jgi:hypothetical protein
VHLGPIAQEKAKWICALPTLQHSIDRDHLGVLFHSSRKRMGNAAMTRETSSRLMD